MNHSLLGPRAHLHSWSLVEDSILFEGVDVGQRARIQRAVVDEGGAPFPRARRSATISSETEDGSR